MGQPYRIISFDGGGICGAFSVEILLRLVAACPSLLLHTDLFAGTSTGGLIAIALASCKSPGEILELYKDAGKTIFSRGILHDIFGQVSEAKYPGTGLEQVAHSTFGGSVLKDLPFKALVPAFRLKESGADPSWRCEYFHNLTGSPSGNELAADVAIRTASAPTYFPSYQGYVDGGIFANDPAMAAIAHAVAFEKVDPQDIRLLSISTGGQVQYLNGTQLDWGALQWVRPIIDAFMAAQSINVDTQAGLLLGDRYRRVSPIIPDIAMDDVGKVPELISLADQADLKSTQEWINTNFLG